MNVRPDKYGNPVSILGFGCMRFTQSMGKIDLEKAEREVMTAFRGGVNYFDTAYIYPGSEAAMGEIFERNGIRDQVLIATKLPHYLVRSDDTPEKIFTEQLRRLRTDYVDYYLMHMLTDTDAWERLKSHGILEWLEEKKRSGAIRQVGFSYHGNTEMFCKLLDAYDWDFCQIQYNYMDENSQAGRRGLRYAHEKGLPVIIMEPLRGGRLVNGLSAKARALFEATGKSPASWAFRWLWDQEKVTVVLSGMNSMEMLEENLQTAEESRPGMLTEADRTLYSQVKQEIQSRMKVPCTGCRYCMPCPFGVDIPGTFHCYNMIAAEGWFSGMKQYVMCTVLRKEPSYASLCHKCGKCESHCPQGIPIRDKLQEAAKSMERVPFKAVRWANKTFKLWK